MLKKNNRLLKGSEFGEIKEKGRVYHSPFFGLAVIVKDDCERKMGMIVSKKISKRAVDRNRIRRLLACGVKNNWSMVPKGTRMVFLAKQVIKGKKMIEVENEIQKTMKSLKSKNENEKSNTQTAENL